jgi:uncharacterized membrane protein
MKNPLSAVLCYVTILVLQPIWHGLLPAPLGNQSLALTLLSTSPLLIPLGGILMRQTRSMIWGSYLVVLYFIGGVMEAWSNPPQRIPALLQVGLTLLYVFLLVNITRSPPGQTRRTAD